MSVRGTGYRFEPGDDGPRAGPRGVRRKCLTGNGIGRDGRVTEA